MAQRQSAQCAQAANSGRRRQPDGRNVGNAASSKQHHSTEGPSGRGEMTVPSKRTRTGDGAVDGRKVKRRKAGEATSKDTNIQVEGITGRAGGHGEKKQRQQASPRDGSLKPGASNWEKMRHLVAPPNPTSERRRKRKQEIERQRQQQLEAAKAQAATAPRALGKSKALTEVLAIDCEMVGTGPSGQRSELARVCIVNNHGVVVLDTFVRPKGEVVDYRTKVSGIRRRDLEGAPDFETVQRQVNEMISGRILVGHSIGNDLKALLLSHSRKSIRDTAVFPPLMRPRTQGRKPKPRSLKQLAREVLALRIQEGEHSPVDDARAALYLYHHYSRQWEAWLKNGGKRGALAVGHLAAAAAVNRGKARQTGVRRDTDVAMSQAGVERMNLAFQDPSSDPYADL